MNKSNNLLIATVVPVLYLGYKYYNDSKFKKKVNSTLNRGSEYLNTHANTLVGKAEETEDSVKDFFKDTYTELNLSEAQLKKIKKVLNSRFEETKNEVKTILSENQNSILERT